jgi:hypothetical protein
MIELELAALADRIAPDEPVDLPERVLARIGDEARPGSVATHRRRLVAAGVAGLAALSFLSPQVRAAAADLLGVAGIEISSDTPDAPPEPEGPLPDSRLLSLADAQAQADFRIEVPAELGPPEHVTVADQGRVVSMTWRGGRVLLDQFEGRLGPVFSKQVGGRAIEELDVNGATGWWIPSPHDLTYVDRDGSEVTATARLAGTTLVWDGGAGVTFRLEGARLDRTEAVAIARSLR